MMLRVFIEGRSTISDTVLVGAGCAVRRRSESVVKGRGGHWRVRPPTSLERLGAYVFFSVVIDMVGGEMEGLRRVRRG